MIGEILNSTLAAEFVRLPLYKRSISESVITGMDPTKVDPSNPITLFIIQLFIIIAFTQGLGWAFQYINQPRVIAEVIGGIILGPTVMGRIPHFTQHIFPPASIPYLNLVANVGLVLFLFVIGVEVDINVMKKNGVACAAISVAGMILPFGLGAAVAVPTYHNFVDTDNVSFGHFMLFIGVAMAITAFPVLCRILTSTKLLDTKVGVIVLAAGVGNDVVGWVLLALTLALVGSGTGATAVYVLLAAVGWSILLLWPIKKGFVWLVKRSGSLEHGPTPGIMTLTLMIIFTSAFMTGIIGVHPIFGGFLAGLIIPHNGGFAIALVEKIDDLVSLLFLPIYFVLSGLATNLGLLDTGKIWGYIILLCVVAFLGKFVGCAGAAMAMRYPLRESAAIGMLMSCKGLVELIVLNVGLNAGIIDQKLFSMLVIVAIVLTFITTPGTIAIYPEHLRERLHGPSSHKKDQEHITAGINGSAEGGSGGRENINKFLFILHKLEHLSAFMFLTQLLEAPAPSTPRKPFDASEAVGHEMKKGDLTDGSTSSTPENALARLPTTTSTNDHSSSHPAGVAPSIDALKLMELTGRTHSVMQSAEKDQLLVTDDALQLFKQFGRLKGLEVKPHISIVEQDSYHQAVSDYSHDLGSELVILPWTKETGGMSSSNSTSVIASQFETIFGNGVGDSSGASPIYTHFIRKVFSECSEDIALFVDRGFGSSTTLQPGSGQHIFLPFFGGPDDRLSLRFVVQLCKNNNVTATIVRIEKPDGSLEEDEEDAISTNGGGGKSESVQVHQAALASNQLTVGPTNSAYPETQARLASDTADNIAWTYYASPSATGRSSSIDNALSRISFFSTKSATPLSFAFRCATSTIQSSTNGGGYWRPMLIVTGRGRRSSPINHSQELNKILADKGLNPSIGAELRKTVGDPATSLILGGGLPGTASFLVMEAGKK
uniref:Potassium:hydrogen antiporter n=1 Tax=Kwoniella bestiolae CBS 10118 TaxID=1296100 RepID=A0A1B9GCF5_9TREE|nr:potassium:hydrogen antiporter [Kwoniella bestiolae CBS 10118]OCF28707.1 potassium:hydrogen antiporter [Kwoniella bestiolae CBS 10118]